MITKSEQIQYIGTGDCPTDFKISSKSKQFIINNQIKNVQQDYIYKDKFKEQNSNLIDPEVI